MCVFHCFFLYVVQASAASSCDTRDRTRAREVIANKMSASGWSQGIATAPDMDVGDVFMVDARPLR
jgi:hypothetical protein